MGLGAWLTAAALGASCTFGSLQPQDARYRSVPNSHTPV